MVISYIASSPGHSQILSRSHGCEIKSGSGLGTRLVIFILTYLHIKKMIWWELTLWELISWELISWEDPDNLHTCHSFMCVHTSLIRPAFHSTRDSSFKIGTVYPGLSNNHESFSVWNLHIALRAIKARYSIFSLEPRLSVPDFVSQLWFLQSCETKSGMESLGSRLFNLHVQ